MTNETAAGHPWWSRYAVVYDRLWSGPVSDALASEVVRALSGTQGMTVDIGCGTGLISRRLVQDGHTVVGVDPSDAMLRRLVHNAPAVRAVRGSLDSAPLRPRWAGAVVATNVLHLHPRPGEAFANLVGLVRPHGRVICSWPRQDVGPHRLARAERRAGVGAATRLARRFGRVVVGLASPARLRRQPDRVIRWEVTRQAGWSGVDLQWFEVPAAEQVLVVAALSVKRQANEEEASYE